MDHTRPNPAPDERSVLLLVDDKQENLFALEVLLKSEYRLLSATSGPQALEMLKDREVDVILLDIQMPGMDGYETARQIKRYEHCRNTPIIFVTAIYTESPHIRKGYEAGAVDYFTKPFDPDILKIKVAIYASFRQKHALLKERERRIKESEELLKAGRKLAAILETLPVGVIIADAEGRIVQTNDEILRIWKSIEPFESDSYGQFLEWWGCDGQLVKAAFNEALHHGKSSHDEIIKVKCFDHSVKTVISSISPLRGLDNRIMGAAAVIQDMTEHKKIEEDIEQRILKLISLGVSIEQNPPLV